MSLIIQNKLINTPIVEILHEIKRQTNRQFLDSIHNKGEYITITCPFHKDGQEKHPSCGVYTGEGDKELQAGWFNCFTCGEKGPLAKLVSYCLNRSTLESEQWLIDNYSTVFVENQVSLNKIELYTKPKTECIDESELNKYAYFHPYMFQRGLTEETILKFRIGFNKDTNSITFPIWNEHGTLIGLTERNVSNKYFYIPNNIVKPVYLLNYIIKERIKRVVVCEGQIDALKCWSWGIPAIALIGTGTYHQYIILNKSGILNYKLALDGDMAGHHGNLRFIKNIKNDCLIDIIKIPKDKDVGDLTKEEFLNLSSVDKNNYK